MKKYAIILILLWAAILNVGLIMEGCNGKIPPMTAFVPTAVPTLGPNIVSNFEDGSIYLNPNLYKKTPSGTGVWSALPAGNFIFPGGANGTAMAGHIAAGPKPMNGYSPFEVTAIPNPTGSYDLSGSPYSGIKFFWKVGATDNMTFVNGGTAGGRWFICPIAPQLPPPLGDCPGTGGGCYDTFKHDLIPDSIPGAWNPVTISFASLGQKGWGFPQVGPLTASYNGIPNLSRVEYFQWEEDPNGAPIGYPTPFTVDFWVDEIQLY